LNECQIYNTEDFFMRFFFLPYLSYFLFDHSYSNCCCF